MNTTGRNPARIAVVGPTASGKSSVALAAAERVGDVDLISVDSMQVYRGMDIGTAKASAAEQARVPHHLIDLVDPTVDFGVAEFQQAYERAVADIGGRGRRAILVGGTGLYHRAVIDDLELPGEWPKVRARLAAEITRAGAPTMHARLAELDPSAAAKMEPTNERRIVRALEVCEGSGRPFSSFGPGLDSYPSTAVAQIGLRWERPALARRIEQRVHQMMTDGLLAEVEALVHRELSRTARQALGYKELLAYLEGAVSLDEATELIVVRTRQFAVRQERWFRRDPRVVWVDVESDPVAEVLPDVLSALR